MSRQRIRSVNFTPQEVILLVDMVIKHKDILECKQADSAMWKQKNDIWNKITNEFNDHNKNVQRDMKTLRLKYDCLKREVRNKLAKNKNCPEENRQQLLVYEEKLMKALNFNSDYDQDVPDIKIKTEEIKALEDSKATDNSLENAIEKGCEDVDDMPLAQRSKNILNISKSIVNQNRCLAKAQIDVALKKKEYLCKKIECMKEIHELTVKKLKLDIQEKQLSLLSNYCLDDY